jgi:hypothetical protein
VFDRCFKFGQLSLGQFLPPGGRFGARIQTEKQFPDFIQFETVLARVVDHDELRQDRRVVSPLSAFSRDQRKYANLLVVANR